MRIMLIFGVFVFSSCGSSLKVPQGSNKSLRSEAKDFVFGILKNYFEDNCRATYGLFSDSIIDLSEAVVDPKPKNNEQICKHHSKVVRDKTKTLNDYFNTYNYIIKDYGEIINSLDQGSPLKALLKEGDFLFDGIRRKPEFYNTKDFIWTSSFIILVRKENGMWRFKGMASD